MSRDRVGQRKIRQSQTLTPFGVGAIFDIRGESFVAQDTWKWGRRGTNIRSERLAAALRVQEFRCAPATESSWTAVAAAGIPYARFPAWLFCQQCRGMVRWRRAMEQDDRAPSCATCPGKRQLVPMRWIQICPAGHMDDLDWHHWAHSKRHGDAAAGRCEIRDKLEFQTRAGAGAGGLDTLYVRCRACRQERDLAGITSADSLKSVGIKCKGIQPWQSWDSVEACAEIPRAVQRGASNVWFPTVHSSIEVPNPSRADAESEDALRVRNNDFFRALFSVSDDSPQFQFAAEMVAQQESVTVDFVVALVRDEKNVEAGRATAVTAGSGDLLAEEWAAFVTESDNAEDRDFRTRHVGIGEPGSGVVTSLLHDRVARIVAVDRLREVRALEGFHRVSPDERPMVRVDLGRGLKWLPAIEVHGEGIFVSLEEGRLAAWEEHAAVAARAAEMDRRIDGSFMASRFRERTGPRLTPRYLLLHTMAHVLIRRLAFESGYSAASLRERVYAKYHAEEGASPQAGVLIYTAAGDSEGTLGGLVRQAEPPRFARTLLDALHDAMWCSADPLCSEKRSTSLNGLNFSACHACSLLAETSCETGNYLLDRAVLVGHDTVPGFFQEVLQESLAQAGAAVTQESP